MDNKKKFVVRAETLERNVTSRIYRSPFDPKMFNTDRRFEQILFVRTCKCFVCTSAFSSQKSFLYTLENTGKVTIHSNSFTKYFTQPAKSSK